MRRALAMMFCGLGLGLSVPPAAIADGNPVGPLLGGAGVTVPRSPFNVVTLPAGRDDTVVEQVRRRDGRVESFNLVRGSYGVPGVGYGGSGTGLSADRRTLVLERFNNGYSQKRTALIVLNGRSLRIRARISLPGFLTVDAVSPTGRWLYLTHYKSFTNISRYEVLAYDLAFRRMLPDPIVDPRDPGEKMQGTPVTRAVSADGRWAYTLYYRGTEAPFIHALDTTSQRAFCIDLPRRLSRVAGSLQLALRARTLRLTVRDRALALVDTRTLAVRVLPALSHSPTKHSAQRASAAQRAAAARRASAAQPAPAARPAGARPAPASHKVLVQSLTRAGHDHGSLPWLPATLALAAALAVALLTRRRIKGRSGSAQTGSSATSRWTRAA